MARTRLPLGEYTKQQDRALAEAAGFVNAEKPDSEDICFVPDGDYGAMIERYLGKRAGTENVPAIAAMATALKEA